MIGGPRVLLFHLKDGIGKAWAGQLRLRGNKDLLFCELISETLENFGPDNPIGSKIILDLTLNT